MDGWVGACVFACVRMYVRACVCVCVYVYVYDVLSGRLLRSADR